MNLRKRSVRLRNILASAAGRAPNVRERRYRKGARVQSKFTGQYGTITRVLGTSIVDYEVEWDGGDTGGILDSDLS